jgi:hypothetical protein
VRERTE